MFSNITLDDPRTNKAILLYIGRGSVSSTVAIKLLFAFIWTFVLGWLCNKGLRTLSWFLVLLPYIIIALAMFRIYNVTRGQKNLLKALQLQGAYGQ